VTIQLFYLKENRYYKTNVGNKRINPINKCVKCVNHHVYSKYVFMLLTDIPLYLVLYTFGTYLYFVFVYMNVFLVFFFVSIHQPTQPGVLIITICLYFLMSCNVLSVLNKLLKLLNC